MTTPMTTPMTSFDLSKRHVIETIIAPIAENTEVISAGALAIGVEHRAINEDTVRESVAISRQSEGAAAGPAQPVDEDGGVSLHVCDAETGDEYLRFDMFDLHPHYHYINHAGGYQFNIAYDRRASGDMFDWVTACLNHRLREMLEYCDAPELAARVDDAAIKTALPQIVAAVQSAAEYG